MTRPPFSSPAAPSAGIDLKAIAGSLLLVDVHALEVGINTAYGTSDAIRADVTVLDGPHAGDHYRDTLLFPKLLQQQLKGSVGSKILGRLGQGAGKPGQSPPWILSEATAADTVLATEYLTKATVSSAAPPF